MARRTRRIAIGWSIPTDVVELLNNDSLQRRDKIELIIVAYSNDHGGNAPSMAEIAGVLNIPKANVQHDIDELILVGRARRIDGKLFITQSEFTHPLTKRFYHT